ncbi:chloride channel protein [Plectonema cf. radiosum LEGE 06105]|uniref:Chloride channel protein n=1 Tax=Plectonema cf. radiosum LEGE 06105 TaxID=945769 RepID=A0A8J7F9B8_9CYAN|nr:chloride channel protein [Plectonema radiosum]MBE9211928.1 chloride channel protein [Plectonema cf. radiosum LEGE 06105]
MPQYRNLFVNKYFRDFWQPRRGLAIAEACIIGVVAALSAVFLRFSSGWLGTFRVSTSYAIPAFLALPLIGVSFGFLTGFLVERFAPEASGSGVPQVKASLANIPIRLSWRVAAVKLVSAILTLGSGMTLGRQGPTVHVGAALAAGMSRVFPTSPDHRRQMIAAGAGAGLAAAFNAPITGILFVVEELLQDLSGLTLGTAIIASFIGGVVSRLLGGRSLQLNLELIDSKSSFIITELPFYLFLGILAGLLAALFRKGLLLSLSYYRKLPVGLPLRIALAGLISGIAIAMLPELFRNNTGLREFIIAGQPSVSKVILVFVAEFILTLVAFGSGAPGGLFAPSLILGSCLGYLVGVAEFNILGLSSPNTYALVGMGAFFSAVSKVPITAIMIIFEITTDFNLVLPLMIGSVTSYLVADKLIPGSLYTKLLQLNGIDIDTEVPINARFIQLTAQEVMQRQVETLQEEMTVDEAIQAFSNSTQRGFPILENGKLVGIVTQSDLMKIREGKLSRDAPIREIMTSHPVTITPKHTLSNVFYLLDRHQISRLPVLEGRRLVGMISRGDIIRAEANYLNCKGTPNQPKIKPSYIVYQTQSPSVGRGRLLVLIANPQTADTLLDIAAQIAQYNSYEVECLQVIIISPHNNPAETPVKTAQSRKLLLSAEIVGKKWKIPVHTQIRVAHNVANATLETIKDRNINKVLMGWKGGTSTPGRIFGNVVDTIIRQASCEVILVKLGKNLNATLKDNSFITTSFNRCLLPMAGGPNSKIALNLLPALVVSNQKSRITLTQVFPFSETKTDLTVLQAARHQLVDTYKVSNQVTTIPIRADSVAQGIINLVKTKKSDVVLLGASREGMLQQAVKGNIPEAIVYGVDCTVILVRGMITE